MIFTKPVHRAVASGPPPAGGKPTAAFQPNTGYANYPTLSALYLTNLISGQTPYVEDSIPSRTDFTQDNGAFGVYPEGEGYLINVTSASYGGNNSATVVGTGSFAYVVEFTMTRDSTDFTYLIGHGESHPECFGPRNAGCAQEGIYYRGAAYCLGSIGDSAIHRLAYKMWRRSSGSQMSIALDGTMLHDGVSTDFNRGTQTLRIGRNDRGRSQRLWCGGAWEWTTPYDGADPLPDAAMIELSADPWPHLAVLD